MSPRRPGLGEVGNPVEGMHPVEVRVDGVTRQENGGGAGLQRGFTSANGIFRVPVFRLGVVSGGVDACQGDQVGFLSADLGSMIITVIVHGAPPETRCNRFRTRTQPLRRCAPQGVFLIRIDSASPDDRPGFRSRKRFTGACPCFAPDRLLESLHLHLLSSKVRKCPSMTFTRLLSNPRT